MALLVVLTVALSGVLQAAPNLYCGERNAQVVDGAVHLAQQWQAAFTERFEDDTVPWTVKNYEAKLMIGADRDGQTGSCLSVKNLAAQGDTAFEVTPSRSARYGLVTLPLPASSVSASVVQFAPSVLRLIGASFSAVNAAVWSVLQPCRPQ